MDVVERQCSAPPPGVSYSSATEKEEVDVLSTSTISARPLYAKASHDVLFDGPDGTGRPSCASTGFAAWAEKGTTSTASAEPAPNACSASSGDPVRPAPCAACLTASVKIRCLSDQNDALRKTLSRKDKELRERDAQLRELQEQVAALECTTRIASLDRTRSTLRAVGLSDSEDDQSPKHLPNADFQSCSEGSDLDLLLPDDEDSLGDLDCTNQLGSAVHCQLNKSSEGYEHLVASPMPLPSPMAAAGTVRDPLHDTEASELGMTNQLGPVLQQDHPNCRIVDGKQDDASDLGVTNRLGTSELSREFSFAPPSAELPPMSFSGAHVAATLQQSCHPCHSEAANAEATPTVRGTAPDASPMADTRWNHWQSSPTTMNEELHSQAAEAADIDAADATVQIIRSSPCSNSTEMASLGLGQREPTLQIFSGKPPIYSGRCFLESPLS